VLFRSDGTPAGSPSIQTIGDQTLAEAWLVDNAALDARLGLPLGLLADGATPAPSASPSPTDEPATPTDQPAATPTPTTAPTPSPTTKPTPKPTPKPTTTGPASLGSLTVVNNGDGTYKFQWPKYTGSGFQFYKLLHGPVGTDPAYGTSEYWACPTSAGANSWSGAIAAGDYAVRVQVVDTSNLIRAQSNTVRLTVSPPPTLPPVVNLGALTYTDNLDGTYTFRWTQYTGAFSYYKLAWGNWPGSPSYPSGSPYWAVPPVGASSSDPITIGPGDYAVRIQAIGYPGGSAHAYAQTTVLRLTIPAPVATPTPTPTPAPTPTPTPAP
jgi:hypothetical protein